MTFRFIGKGKELMLTNGNAAPNVTLKTTDGEPVSLATALGSIPGTIAFVAFGASLDLSRPDQNPVDPTGGLADAGQCATPVERAPAAGGWRPNQLILVSSSRWSNPLTKIKTKKEQPTRMTDKVNATFKSSSNPR